MQLNTEQQEYLKGFFAAEAEHNALMAKEDADLATMYMSDAEQCLQAIKRLNVPLTVVEAAEIVKEFDTYEDLLYKIGEVDEREDIAELLADNF
jgi:hypothetical protein